MAEPTRVLIADDQATDRAGIEALLAHRPDIAVVGLADSAASVLPQAQKLRPEVVLIDLSWNGNERQGASIIKKLKQAMPEVLVVALTNYSALISDALDAGADDAVTKTYTREQLVSLIRGVSGQALVEKPKDNREAAELSERELEVLHHMAEGKADKEIAYEMGVSTNTVKHHVSKIYQKLGAANRAEAIAIGYQRHLIQVER
jgi:DNA-binding NarL/FixJ family response regulator